MIRTQATEQALDFCAAALRLGLGLEVQPQGRGRYELRTRDLDEGMALWWLLSDGVPCERVDRCLLQASLDAFCARAEALGAR